MSTLNTIYGFAKAWLRRRLPVKHRPNALSDIYNYYELPELYTTSGQPEAHEFQLIKSAGFDLVINLAPYSSLENSLLDEEDILKELELDYIHIPVDFQNPEESKFRQFLDSLEANQNRRIWIHCAANMRVSAFCYRYRTQTLDESEESCKPDLEAIWQPFGVWKDFIRGER